MNSEKGIAKFFRPIINVEDWKQLLADAAYDGSYIFEDIVNEFDAEPSIDC